MKPEQKLAIDAVKRQTPPTPYRLATVGGWDKDTVYAWVHGKRSPRGGNLIKLMQFAGKSLGAAAVIIAALHGNVGDANAATEKSVQDLTLLQIIRSGLRWLRSMVESPQSCQNPA